MENEKFPVNCKLSDPSYISFYFVGMTPSVLAPVERFLVSYLQDKL